MRAERMARWARSLTSRLRHATTRWASRCLQEGKRNILTRASDPLSTLLDSAVLPAKKGVATSCRHHHIAEAAPLYSTEHLAFLRKERTVFTTLFFFCQNVRVDRLSVRKHPFDTTFRKKIFAGFSIFSDELVKRALPSLCLSLPPPLPPSLLSLFFLFSFLPFFFFSFCMASVPRGFGNFHASKNGNLQNATRA